VRLRNFYASSVLDGNWQFVERREYLRLIGALDESDASDPRLIIPNYLYSHANCLNVSRFYNMCCMNRCDRLLAHVETRIQAPHATPAEIIDAISALPLELVRNNRSLSSALQRKLQQVAERHHGWVPLHGRLFSQWMHMVYPRECPYPHVSGTTELLTDFEWTRQTGSESTLTDEELRIYLDSTAAERPARRLDSLPSAVAAEVASSCSDEESGDGLCPLAMWTHEEELVDALNGRPPTGNRTGRASPGATAESQAAGTTLGSIVVFRPLMLAVLPVSFAMTLLGLARRVAVSLGHGFKTAASAREPRILTTVVV